MPYFCVLNTTSNLFIVRPLLIASSLFFSLCGFSQNTWEPIKESNGIKIYQKTADCEFNKGFDEQRYLFKFENTTSEKVDVSWRYLLWYDDKCTNCESIDEDTHTITLAPNETKEGQCHREAYLDLQLFVKFNSGQEFLRKDSRLTKFEITDLKLNK